jgi:hypothetical protein
VRCLGQQTAALHRECATSVAADDRGRERVGVAPAADGANACPIAISFCCTVDCCARQDPVWSSGRMED